MEDWGGVRKEFVRHPWLQKEWENQGFTYEETKEWINIGFALSDSRNAEQWRNKDFVAQQAKEWINAGLTLQESEFAFYLKQNDYQSEQISDLEELREEYHVYQGWVRAGFEPHNQIKEWFAIGLQPTDYEFVSYLEEWGYNPQMLLDHKEWLKKQREEYSEWKNLGITTYKLQKEWIDKGFSLEQAKAWIKVGLKSADCRVIQEPNFYAWLRDEVKITASEAFNELTQDEIKVLRELFQENQQNQMQTLQVQSTHNNH